MRGQPGFDLCCALLCCTVCMRVYVFVRGMCVHVYVCVHVVRVWHVCEHVVRVWHVCACLRVHVVYVPVCVHVPSCSSIT